MRPEWLSDFQRFVIDNPCDAQGIAAHVVMLQPSRESFRDKVAPILTRWTSPETRGLVVRAYVTECADFPVFRSMLRYETFRLGV